MKKLRVKRGTKAVTLLDIGTFMHAYTHVFGDPYIQCQTDLQPGKLFSAAELYKKIKHRFASVSGTKRQWAMSALRFFGL